MLAVKYLTERASRLDIGQNEVIFRINRDGFKGPEIDKTHSKLRILTIGDSTTFGTWFDRYSYPRVLETELTQKGVKVEVINAGVEGYGPTNVLWRIEEFKGLNPEYTTIYLGWNALYTLPEVCNWSLYSVALLKRAVNKFAPPQNALDLYLKPKQVDRDALAVRCLENWYPPFMDKIEQIVLEMQSSGSQVILVTLPGLYTMNEVPTPDALEKGHLPPFTDNPYVLAKMSQQYNTALRELAEKQNLPVIDLERWSETALQPRDQYFFDAVHLYEEGQMMIGKYMADELYPLVTDKR